MLAELGLVLVREVLEVEVDVGSDLHSGIVVDQVVAPSYDFGPLLRGPVPVVIRSRNAVAVVSLVRELNRKHFSLIKLQRRSLNVQCVPENVLLVEGVEGPELFDGVHERIKSRLAFFLDQFRELHFPLSQLQARLDRPYDVRVVLHHRVGWNRQGLRLVLLALDDPAVELRGTLRTHAKLEGFGCSEEQEVRSVGPNELVYVLGLLLETCCLSVCVIRQADDRNIFQLDPNFGEALQQILQPILVDNPAVDPVLVLWLVVDDQYFIIWCFSWCDQTSPSSQQLA